MDEPQLLRSGSNPQATLSAWNSAKGGGVGEGVSHDRLEEGLTGARTRVFSTVGLFRFVIDVYV